MDMLIIDPASESAAALRDLCGIDEAGNPAGKRLAHVIIPRMIEGGPYRGRACVSVAVLGDDHLEYAFAELARYRFVDLDINLAWPEAALECGRLTFLEAAAALTVPLAPTPPLAPRRGMPRPLLQRAWRALTMGDR